jgi:hypothetical protein
VIRPPLDNQAYERPAPSKKLSKKSALPRTCANGVRVGRSIGQTRKPAIGKFT